MSTEDTTPEALPEGGQEPSEDGGEAASESQKTIAETLSEHLGKEFKDDDSALKAVKDTFKYVGSQKTYKETIAELEKAGISESEVLNRIKAMSQEQKEGNVEEKIAEVQQQLDESNFYRKNPDLEQYSGLLNELRGSSGKSLAEVAESDAFKTVVEKAKKADEYESSKSVLESNPKLGQARDKITEAREAAQKGDFTSAKNKAVGAVMDAFSE